MTVDGKAVELDVPAEITFEDAETMEGMPNVDGAYANGCIYRIKVKVSSSGKVNITAKLSPANIEASDVSEYDTDMEKWTILDGEIPEVPLLDAIYIDGEKLLDFDPQKQNYKVTFYEGDEHIPQITAESSEYNIEITETNNKKTLTVIKVSYKNDPDVYTNYIINYVELPKAASLEGYTVHDVKAVTAVSEPQAENPKEAVLDGDFGTRWSAEGVKDVWIDLDLGLVKEFDSVFMSTYQGGQRGLVFKILVSEDGEKYTEVYAGQTSGKTEDLEEFKIGMQKARHVRISCYGTNVGNWNSIMELAVAKSN